MVRSICVTVAYRVPEFGIGSPIMDLLSAGAANWDATMIGLRALLIILLDAPNRSASSSPETSYLLVGGDPLVRILCIVCCSQIKIRHACSCR